ncbi:DoxX family protein [Actinopolymorpha sp. B11F2]|uniref:DoxX family protein n=1 Tax=Actinopolymorpha sp. B11F2 TaxID=3160862 RepID=UPI0032E50518
MATTTRPTTERTTGGRAKSITLWVLQVVTALWFLMAALGKFTGDEVVVATFDAIGFGDWFRYLIGVLEVAGAVAMLIPRLVGLAALGFVGLMAGAVLIQLLVVGSGAFLPVPLLVVSALIAWGRWSSTRQLWALVTSR